MELWVNAFFGALFLLASLAKFDAWTAWTQTTKSLVPEHALIQRILLFGIPVVEFSIAVITLWIAPQTGLYLSALLLGVFSIGVALATRRHAGNQCNCFGALMPSQIGYSLALRNLGLVAVLAGILGFAALSPRPLNGPESASLMAGLISMMLVATYWRDIRPRAIRLPRGAPDG